MWRKTHLWLGLFLSFFILIISLTGTILATKPLYEQYSNGNVVDSSLSVAKVVETIAQKNKRITTQKLRIYPSGEVAITYTIRNKIKKRAISLETGQFLKKKEEPKIYEFIGNLHRSFLLGDSGRIVPAIAAIAMFLLSISGLILLVRRLGGIKNIVASMSWKGLSNQHSALGRLVIIPIFIIIISALWLSAVTFKFVSTGEDVPPKYPESLQKLAPVEPWTLEGLQNIPISDVVEIVYPIPSDWFDVWTVKTHNKYIFIDQFTGKVLSEQPLSIWAIILDWIIVLHTGKGTFWWAIILFLSSLSIPFFAISGIIMWFKTRKRKGGKIHHQARKNQAEIIILVGSENANTWGFAKALHNSLVKQSLKVHTTEMNAINGKFSKMKTLLVLTSTYGDGDAPESAKQFLKKIDKVNLSHINYAVLGFGDRAFPKFCYFAHQVAVVLEQKYAKALLPTGEIDKQSSQAFSSWVRALGEVLSLDLDAKYEVPRPKTNQISLFFKQDFAQDVASMSILRFNAKSLPKHIAGDWLAVYPPDCNIPRLYSLGSVAKKDNFVEICVRLQENGLCSTFLCNLSLEQKIEVTVIPNSRFHLPKKGNIIMIGAGTGIAPFIGMIKHNYSKRNITLFWGGRSPEIDGIYQEEIKDWLDKQYLTNYYPAWSRYGDKCYVQQQIARHHQEIVEQLSQGATIMICGGSNMAQAVYEEIDMCARKLDISVEELKKQNRYLEDVY